MKRPALALLVALGLAGSAVGGCAAIGGLGDFEEVACTDCEGGTSATDSPFSSPETSSTDATTDGGGSDAPVDAPKDAPPLFEDAAVGIKCSAATCSPTTEHCCVGGGDPTACAAAAVACKALSISCDDRDDCAAQGLVGDICCAKLNAGGQTLSVSCSAFAACTGSHAVLCNPLTAVPCPNGGSCLAATEATLNGYSACR